MTDLHKAAEIALGVLLDPKTRADEVAEAVKALRQALAEEKPWVKTYCGGKPNYCTPEVTPDVDAVNMSQERVDETAKREHEWVGLTDDEVDALADDHLVAVQEYIGIGEYLSSVDGEVEFARAIEAKLKEKNG